MNLTKLFESQKILRDHIGYNEPDRFEKLVLALLVEIGECANEYRAWKFWSKDQKPRTKVLMPGKRHHTHNPLLEEYVDGKHFILELGIEKGWTPVTCDMTFRAENVTMQFLGLFEQVSIFRGNVTKNNYYNLLSVYVGLGEMLGFTDEQIEEAYFAKNQINHERQENGY